MKGRLLILVPVVLGMSVAAHVPAASSIGGRVVAAATGRAITAARVTLSEADAGVGSATTDADGRFEMSGIRAGRFRLGVSASAYRTAGLNAAPLIGHTPLAVNAGENVNDIVIQLHRGGTIAGRVVDRAGEPVIAGLVRAFRTNGGAGNRLMSTAGRAMGLAIAADARTETDDRGQYRLIGVEPGEYVVGVVDRTSVTFAPASTTLAGATPVAMGVDEERAGVNIQVERAQSGTIAGVVTGAGAAGSTPVTVELQADPNDARLPSLTAPIQPDGRFTFADVPVGRHALLVRPAYMSSEVMWGRTSVVVARDGPVQAILPLRPGARMSGRIVPVFSTRTIELGPVASESVLARARAQVLSDGSFAFTNLVPGQYQWLRSPGLVGSYGPRSLMSVIIGGEDVTDTPLAITETTALVDVRLAISEGAVMSGTVRDAAGNPTTAGAVVIAPVDRAHATEVSRRLRVVRADSKGYFEARSLPPGNYRVAHVMRLDTGHIWDTAFLSALAGTREVILPEAQTVTVDLRVK